MTPRTTIHTPARLEPCTRCNAPVIYTDRNAADPQTCLNTGRPIHVDPLALNQQGLLAATILDRRIHAIALDPIQRIRVYTSHTPTPVEKWKQRATGWRPPTRWTFLGWAPRHRCGTSLPGKPLPLPTTTTTPAVDSDDDACPF